MLMISASRRPKTIGKQAEQNAARGGGNEGDGSQQSGLCRGSCNSRSSSRMTMA